MWGSGVWSAADICDCDNDTYSQIKGRYSFRIYFYCEFGIKWQILGKNGLKMLKSSENILILTEFLQFMANLFIQLCWIWQNNFYFPPLVNIWRLRDYLPLVYQPHLATGAGLSVLCWVLRKWSAGADKRQSTVSWFVLFILVPDDSWLDKLYCPWIEIRDTGRCSDSCLWLLIKTLPRTQWGGNFTPWSPKPCISWHWEQFPS